MSRDLDHVEIRPASWRCDAATLAPIRRRVFVEEQAVPEALEWDGEDPSAEHWLGLVDGQPVGTVRMLGDGHIGRMAVLAASRRRGVGSALLEAAVRQAQARGLAEVYLHAQVQAVPFYARHGFRAEGAVFMDAGIPHRNMRRALQPLDPIAS